MAGGLDFLFRIEVELYYLCSKNKDADHIHVYSKMLSKSLKRNRLINITEGLDMT